MFKGLNNLEKFVIFGIVIWMLIFIVVTGFRVNHILYLLEKSA